MKTNDIISILGVALATASLTVIGFSSGPLNAGGEAEKPAPQKMQPRLLVHGIALTLAVPEDGKLRAGEQPALELTAINTTGENASASIEIEMTASSPENPVSRVLLVPTALWQGRETLVLKPNETKVVPIPVSAQLPPDKMIEVALREADPATGTTGMEKPGARVAQSIRLAGMPQGGIVALSFSTAVPAAEAASIR